MLGRVGELLGYGPQQKPNPVRTAAIRHKTKMEQENLKGNFRTLAEQIVNSPSSVGLAGIVIASLFGKASASVNTTAAINEAVNCLESDGNCTAKVNTLHQLFQNCSIQGAQDLATIQGLNAQVELLSGANAVCLNTTQQLVGVYNESLAQIKVLEANATGCSVELFEAREFSKSSSSEYNGLGGKPCKGCCKLS